MELFVRLGIYVAICAVISVITSFYDGAQFDFHESRRLSGPVIFLVGVVTAPIDFLLVWCRTRPLNLTLAELLGDRRKPRLK